MKVELTAGNLEVVFAPIELALRLCLAAWPFCIQSQGRGPGIKIYRLAQRGGMVGRDGLFYRGGGTHPFQPGS